MKIAHQITEFASIQEKTSALEPHCSPCLSLAIEFCNLSQLGVREIYLVYVPFV